MVAVPGQVPVTDRLNETTTFEVVDQNSLRDVSAGMISRRVN